VRKQAREARQVPPPKRNLMEVAAHQHHYKLTHHHPSTLLLPILPPLRLQNTTTIFNQLINLSITPPSIRISHPRHNGRSCSICRSSPRPPTIFTIVTHFDRPPLLDPAVPPQRTLQPYVGRQSALQEDDQRGALKKPTRASQTPMLPLGTRAKLQDAP